MPKVGWGIEFVLNSEQIICWVQCTLVPVFHLDRVWTSYHCNTTFWEGKFSSHYPTQRTRGRVVSLRAPTKKTAATNLIEQIRRGLVHEVNIILAQQTELPHYQLGQPAVSFVSRHVMRGSV